MNFHLFKCWRWDKQSDLKLWLHDKWTALSGPPLEAWHDFRHPPTFEGLRARKDMPPSESIPLCWWATRQPMARSRWETAYYVARWPHLRTNGRGRRDACPGIDC